MGKAHQRGMMEITIKKMESDDEIRGKAYVHWKSWHEAYPGLVDQGYLDAMTLDKCEANAFRWPDNMMVAKDGDRVIGFVCYGNCRDEDLTDAGEVIAVYTLSEYYGKGVGQRLMRAALDQLNQPQVVLWVLKGNGRAVRFYEKCGFRTDGTEKELILKTPVTALRMMLKRQ